MAEDIILKGSPQFSKLELVKEGFTDITFTEGNLSDEFIVTHNLGYIPVAVAYLVFQGDETVWYPLPYIGSKTLGTAISFKKHSDFVVTPTRLLLYTTTATGAGTGTATVKYFLFRVRAS